MSRSERTNVGFDKIFVLGAGAIGSICGGLLSKKKDVTLIGNEAHVEALNSKGLAVSGDMNEILHVKADIKIREIPEKTLIILTTKAYDSARATRGIEELLKKDTVILVLQNGLGNKEVVRKATRNKAKVLRGITTMAAEFFEPAEIKFWSGTTTVEKDGVAEKIREAFEDCGLETRLTENIKGEVWHKVTVNCVVNPLSTLFNVRNHEVIADSLRAVRHGIIDECVRVGEAEEIFFPNGFKKEVDKRISGYTNFSSMCQDKMKKKRTEIDSLNGKVVELGRKHHIHTPVNETIVHLVKFMEEKYGVSREDQEKEG